MKGLMKGLRLNQVVLQWLGICPIDDVKNLRKQWIRYIFGFLVCTFIVSMMVANFFYCIKYIDIDIEGVLYAMFSLLSSINVLYAIISLAINRVKVSLIFTRLQELYDQSKKCVQAKYIDLCNFFAFFLVDSGKTSCFDRGDMRSHKVSQLLLKYLTMCIIFNSILMASFNALYIYMENGYVDAKLLFLPFNVV